MKQKKLTLENKELKNQIDEHRNKLESTLLSLRKINYKNYNQIKKYQNDSREFFSEIISEDKALKIYKKKSSIDFKFKIENKIKNKKTDRRNKTKNSF